MKHIFNVGDRVTLNPDSAYNDEEDTSQLPLDVVGTIIFVKERLGRNYYEVEWEGGYNTYEDEDLLPYARIAHPRLKHFTL